MTRLMGLTDGAIARALTARGTGDLVVGLLYCITTIANPSLVAYMSCSESHIHHYKHIVSEQAIELPVSTSRSIHHDTPAWHFHENAPASSFARCLPAGNLPPDSMFLSLNDKDMLHSAIVLISLENHCINLKVGYSTDTRTRTP